MFKRFWWMFLVMLPAGAFAGLVVAAVFTYIMPKMYESEAVIQVRTPEGNSRFQESVLEGLSSRSTLKKVVHDLELTQRWSMGLESAIQVLESAVVSENIQGTDLFSIRVRMTNKSDARDIAAAISASSLGGNVRILEKPEIADAPVAPKVGVNLLVGAASGALLSPLMAVVLIWLVDRLMPTKLVDAAAGS